MTEPSMFAKAAAVRRMVQEAATGGYVPVKSKRAKWTHLVPVSQIIFPIPQTVCGLEVVVREVSVDEWVSNPCPGCQAIVDADA